MLNVLNNFTERYNVLAQSYNENMKVLAFLSQAFLIVIEAGKILTQDEIEQAIILKAKNFTPEKSDQPSETASGNDSSAGSEQPNVLGAEGNRDHQGDAPPEPRDQVNNQTLVIGDNVAATSTSDTTSGA